MAGFDPGTKIPKKIESEVATDLTGLQIEVDW
jgi:hypothetical protein